MVKNSSEHPKETIKFIESCGIDWIEELWAFTEIITLKYSKELTRFSIPRDEFNIIVFSKSFQFIGKDLSEFLWYIYLSDEEISKLEGFESLVRVKETHLKTKKVIKVIGDLTGLLLFPNVLKELRITDLKYAIEYAKKEWMRDKVDLLTTIQREDSRNNQLENIAELKNFSHLQVIIKQIKDGARTVTEVAENLGVTRKTIHRRLKAANISFRVLLSSVTV